MNKVIHMAGWALLFTLAACGDDVVTPVESYDFSAIIDDYVDLAVLATYSDLAAKSAALHASTELLASDGTQTNLDTAAEAWVATREPWESSEGFLFGPVAFLGLDPSMDSWPLDRGQLEDVLESEFELTPDFIREGLNASLRGFHTIEFLLFRDGAPRTAADVTDREKEYLVSASQVLQEDTETLLAAWTDGYEGGGSRPFADEFRGAGSAGSRYVSQVDAVQEMVEGMITIADEVGNGKINDPYAAADPAIVESWFSWNALSDFANNVRSIENAYLGGYHNGTRGVGLSSFVAEEDAALDATVRAQITASIDAIDAIPHPFRNNLDDTATIEAAINALNDLSATLQTLQSTVAGS